jgi:hypothetical protein
MKNNVEKTVGYSNDLWEVHKQGSHWIGKRKDGDGGIQFIAKSEMAIWRLMDQYDKQANDRGKK